MSLPEFDPGPSSPQSVAIPIELTREVIVVSCNNSKKHTNILSGQNADFKILLNLAVHRTITKFRTINKEISRFVLK